MASGPPADATRTSYIPNEARRAVALSGNLEEPFARQQRLQSTGERDAWAVPMPTTLSPVPLNAAGDAYAPLPVPAGQRWMRDERVSWQSAEEEDASSTSPWPRSPLKSQYATQMPISPGDPNQRLNYTGLQGWWPGPPLRRTSSDDTRLSKVASAYYGVEASSSATSLQSKQYPQRRPSNRDEFDGPAQLLDKPGDSGVEPQEEDLPSLPTTLRAQEQDDILSKVNDRLSQCAFDFIARYQFPIPIEPDKRPVRGPGDREWSEWVFLLKRLATKRRIPARVLYNGQIKQLITILENSLEMRHAAKHQSRPLKDDRNVLQPISSGLQVAKILKDANAMQYMDGLYVYTERVIASRRVAVPLPAFSTT